MASSSPPGRTGHGGLRPNTVVKGVGEPCAGEPHARFDGGELEKELAMAAEVGGFRETGRPEPGVAYGRSPRQLPTRPSSRIDAQSYQKARVSRILGVVVAVPGRHGGGVAQEPFSHVGRRLAAGRL